MTYQPVYDYAIPPMVVNAATASNSVIIDADGEALAYIFDAQSTDTLTKIGFLTGTVTTGGTIDVRVETVDAATGFPTGTLWGTTTNYVHTLANSDDNVYVEVTLTSGASLTRGDMFAVVFKRPSGGALNGQLRFITGLSYQAFPSTNIYTAGAWSAYSGNNSPACSLYFSTGGYSTMKGVNGHVALIFSSNVTVTFNNVSTPDVYGNRFSVPFDCKAAGIWVLADFDGDADLKLYGSDGVTVLASVSNTALTPAIASSGVNYRFFSSDVSLSANTVYRVAIEPSSSTSLTAYFATYHSSAIRAQSILGAQAYHTSAKNPTGTGSWTDDETRVVFIGVMLSSIDIPTGGGGGLASNPVGGFIA